ncbi:TPA: hypothetical protein I8372_004141 [Citrobacter farmeri]|uniref:hypothetical protein n=1 Tax=Citrobacter amalonaticus TaxID=35703 RepID=UPI000A3946EA|nr:hypothetical protein [Citrobacter amalonaticus]HAT2746474.1 hypothetical protein [Citrobacter farmeri]OUE59435.1 hypothetical protein AZ012_003716 [Citrobacter amalonaticus]HAT2778940.1 hypothetical protein [Citrobacter farmeri]HAT2809946.1 hypothetical protein [Citrobacter farmeri]HBC0549763.1 hypothetical protein [Citrobacter farmeri]
MSDLSDLDMSDALIGWEQPVKLKTRTETTVDFEPTVIVTSQDILAVVQSANKENLTLDSLDWSKEYLLIHARLKIETGQFIEKGGKDYKVVSPADYMDYGFCSAIVEETRLPLLVPTP